MKTWRQMLICAAATTLVGCTRLVGGAAELPPTERAGPMLPAGIDIEHVMLDIGQMRGITGAGEQLTIIPSMDTKSPVDIDPLAETVPAPCRFVYAETATFGTDTTQFHKIAFQYPPKAALISEAVAAYHDAGSARRAFDTLVSTVSDCADSAPGPALVGDWDADEQSLHIQIGRCASDYRLKSAVLLEVATCGFAKSVSELVITNLADRVPG